MKDRILSYLEELARGEQGVIYQNLSTETGWGATGIKDRANASLSAILHGYSHFSVSTIDSFFQKVIRAFAKEMGLQSAFTIELDVQKVLDFAIDQLMLDVSEDKGLAAWLIEFSESRMDDGKSWDIRKEINKLGYQLFSEEFKKYEAELLQIARDRNYLKEYYKDVEKVKSDFANKLSVIGKNALKIIEENDLTLDDFSYKSAGMMGYLQKLSNKTSFEPGTRARKSIESYDWCGAKHEKKEFITNLVEHQLHPLMEEAINFYDEHIKSYATAQNILKYFYTFGIMADLMSKLEHYRQEESVMLISDVNAFLKDLIGGNDAPFIYEKVGTFYRHFMIDEFQDTSGFQWDNFLPLIQNGLSEGRRNLVVGDVKQSIYRWRGGDWQLLLEGVVGDVGEDYIKEIDLSDNWRSQSEIINFNNTIFTISPVVLAEKYAQSIDVELSAKFILKAYEQAIQNIPASNTDEASKGYVAIEFLEEDKDAGINWKDEAINRTISAIEKAQDRGIALRDIAILVRRNSEGKKMADALLERQALDTTSKYRYDVISPDSLFISGSKAVRIIISCLKYLNNTEDMLALSQLTYDYARFKAVDIGTKLFEKDINTLSDEVLPTQILHPDGQLLKLSVFDLCEKLISMFGLGEVIGEVSYLQGFQEAVLDFTREGNDDMASFLEWWDAYGATRSVQIPDSLDAIRIMTIHKSKGLQFGTVIIPFSNWAFDHSGNNDRIMWLKPQSEPFNRLPLLPVKYGNSLVNTEFVEDFAKERLKAYLDNLNMLYVAFTRAENELMVYAPLPKQTKRGTWSFSNVSDLLYQSINPDFSNSVQPELDFTHHWNAEKQCMNYGQLKERESLPLHNASDLSGLSAYQSINWDERIYIRRNAEGNLHTDNSGLKYGKVMHELLSKVEYLADLDEVLEQATYEGWMPEAEMKNMSAHLKKVLSLPEVAVWFDTAWTVRNEVTVLQKSGDLKRLDRVIEKDGKLIIIDYKTGLPENKDLRQVKEYMNIIRQMGYEDIQAYLLYLGSSEIREVK